MSENNQSDGEAIDPRVEKELEEVVSEEEIFGMLSTDGKQQDKIPIVKDWLPERDNWQGKTVINQRQAHLLSLVRALPHAFEELEEMEPFIDELVTNLEMYNTSVKGKAREQQVSVIGRMFGGGGDDDTARNMIMGAIAGKEGDE